MEFTKPITDIIKQRISVRTYTQSQIEGQKETQLKAFLASNPTGPFQNRLQFEIITAKPGDTEALKGLGTYGMIRNPAGFIIGIMGPGTKNLEDFGYTLEQIILVATDLGLGTCWLGGSFQHSNFAKRVILNQQETLAAVTPIGNPPEKIGLRDSVLRFAIGARKRLLWEQLFFSGDFGTPLAQAEAETYATACEMLRIAPSAGNKQPWRLVKTKGTNTFHFYLHRDKRYTQLLQWRKILDLQRMDMGIAICHFELTAQELGLAGAWQIADPGLRPLPEQTEYIVSWKG